MRHGRPLAEHIVGSGFKLAVDAVSVRRPASGIIIGGLDNASVLVRGMRSPGLTRGR